MQAKVVKGPEPRDQMSHPGLPMRNILMLHGPQVARVARRTFFMVKASTSLDGVRDLHCERRRLKWTVGNVYNRERLHQARHNLSLLEELKGHRQLKHGTAYRKIRPTKLDKIKNLHSTDSIDTKNSSSRGRSIWVHSSQVRLLKSSVPHNSLAGEGGAVGNGRGGQLGARTPATPSGSKLAQPVCTSGTNVDGS